MAILTVSDGCFRGEREDKSGDLIAEWCGRLGYDLADRVVVPDESHEIVSRLVGWVDSGQVDAVLTTGGTGFSPRDVTPEATRSVLDKEAPGLAEAMRQQGLPQAPTAVLSRGLTGSRGTTFIANMPGSPGGVRDGLLVLEEFLPHVVDLLHGHTAHDDATEALGEEASPEDPS